MKFAHIIALAALIKTSFQDTVTVTSTRDYQVHDQTTQAQATTTVYVTLVSVSVSTVTSAAEESGHDHSEESDHDHGSSSVTYQTTAITDCHLHGATLFCVDGAGSEGSVIPAPTNTQNVPSSFTGCHSHATEVFCMDSEGEEYQFSVEASEAEEEHDHDHDHDHVSETATYQTTAVTDCHFHGTTQFCVDGAGKEGSIVPAPTKTEDAPSSYTGCHGHGSDVFCIDSAGGEVQFAAEVASNTGSSPSSTSTSGMNCHFHAGVEHCVAEGESESSSVDTCERVDRDYDIPLRIGLLFVILVTSGIGAFGPLVASKLFNFSLEGGYVMIIIRNFSIGVLISTALVHLMTHAALMWGSSCIKLSYEATGTSITMAGIFLTFMVEYCAHQIVSLRNKKRVEVLKQTDEEEKKISDDDVSEIENVRGHDHFHDANDKVSILVMEAGIIFHSILIGITLVVAGDSYFITLFIVILFHQLFEGLALGSRIAPMKNTKLLTKLLMALGFTLITPIGMAIGIGVLNKFNGNDPSTIIALGTLDSLSAGILLWSSFEMLVQDWFFGTMAHTTAIKSFLGIFAMVAGMVLMSFLGKWA